LEIENMGEPIATVGDLAGICGHDGTNWEKILIDASKRLVVAVASAVANDAQLHGYYDEAWQKAPIPWGFSDVIGSAAYEGDAAAGFNLLTSSTVPAGEVWWCMQAAMVDVTSAVTSMVWKLHRGGTDYQIKRYGNVAAGYTLSPETPVILGPGDYMKYEFRGCTAHDVLFATIAGFKMDLDL
jgi:hypothetical protein